MSTSLSPRSAPVHPTRQQLDELDALLQRMLDLPVNQADEPETPEEEAAAEGPPSVSYKVPIVEPPPLLEPRVVPAEESLRTLPRPTMATPPAAGAAAAPPTQPPAPPGPEIREPGPDDWVRLASTWQPSAQTWQPLAQSWQQAARPTDRAAMPSPAPEPALELPRPPLPERPMELTYSTPEPSYPVERDEAMPQSLEDLFPPPIPAAAATNSAVAAPTPGAATGYPVWQWPLLPVNWVFDLATLPLGPLGAGMRSRIGRNLLAVIGIGCMIAAGVLVAAGEFGWIW